MGDVVVYDYSAQLGEIIANQEETITALEQQNAMLLEQLNGFSIIANYLNDFFAIAIGVICVSLLWTVLNKWFFRGC